MRRGEVLLIGFHAREVGVLSLGHGSAQAHVEDIDVAADRIEWRAQLVAHRAEERRLRPVRGLGAPLEHQRQVVYLRIVERERASVRDVFSELHVLRAVRNTALRADEGDGAQQPLPRDERHRQERSDPQLTQDMQVTGTVRGSGERSLDVAGDGDRACVPQHRGCAEWIVGLGSPACFQLLRELLLFRIGVVDAKAVDGVTLFENVHDAPRAQGRKREPGEGDKRAGLIHGFGKQATGLGEERRPAARRLGVVGETAFAQRTEEHLLRNLPLKLERSVRRA